MIHKSNFLNFLTWPENHMIKVFWPKYVLQPTLHRCHFLDDLLSCFPFSKASGCMLALEIKTKYKCKIYDLKQHNLICYIVSLDLNTASTVNHTEQILYRTMVTVDFRKTSTVNKFPSSRGNQEKSKK